MTQRIIELMHIQVGEVFLQLNIPEYQQLLCWTGLKEDVLVFVQGIGNLCQRSALVCQGNFDLLHPGPANR